MEFCFAPMEGVTDYIFRSIHHRFFPGLDRYYAPFLSPTSDGRFSQRSLKDVLPENNVDIPLVPQLLTRHSQDFLWAARLLADLGCREVDLNLGCPSGTVVAKGKGSGLLGRPEELERLLDEIFAQTPIRVSVKTRLGLKDPEEFPRLLELFARYPLSRLTVHARVREDYYRRSARWDAFALALARSPAPVCCNGDLTTPEAYARFTARYPAASSVMLGRGLVADPALFRRVQGGPPAGRETLRAYHDALFDAYCSAFGSKRNALFRMKEFWFYHLCLFEGGEPYDKPLKKATDPGEYLSLTHRIYDELPLRPAGARPTW